MAKFFKNFDEEEYDEELELSDTSSVASMVTVSSGSSLKMQSAGGNELKQSERVTRKSRAKSTNSSKASSDGLRPLSRVIKRGRGRPPTTGEYVGLAMAKHLHAKAQQEILTVELERETLESLKKADALRECSLKRAPSSSSVEETDWQERSVSQMMESGRVYMGLVAAAASKSKNLKGTMQKQLKQAAHSTAALIEALGNRTQSEENRRLQETNARLQSQLDDLRKEVDELKAALKERNNPAPVVEHLDSRESLMEAEQPLARSPPVKQPTHGPTVTAISSTSNDALVAEIIRQVGTIINARIEGLEDRLLPAKKMRPPLAADAKQNYAAEPSASMQDAAEKPSVMTNNSGKSKPKKGKGKNAKKDLPPQQSPAVSQAAVPNVPKAGTSNAAGPSSWVEVVKKPAKKPKPAETKEVKKGEKGKAKAKPLRPPRTAAVVVSLDPEAQNTGLTYGKVLFKAREVLGDLQKMGIPPLRMRESATGALLMEISGPTGGEKADLLASKLQEISGEGVRITRPVKTADLRISGLDYSISKDEVVAAVSDKGSCPAEQVRAGEIRRGPGGMGTIWVQCPVGAAKILAEGGRLLIGWSSAQVRLLEARPLKCYRCFSTGHTRQKCTESVDRSNLCFRCGKPGHKVVDCPSSSPYCPICAEAKRPASHVAGGKNCVPPSKSKSKKAPARTSGAQNVMQPTQQSVSGEAMDEN
jgi:hypothetical protein